MSIEGPTKPINWAAIEEIANADNEAVLNMLEGAATADVTLSEEDIEEIKAAAIDLGGKSPVEKSAQELFAMAYEKYVKAAGEAGAQIMQNMSDAELRKMVLDAGYHMTDEELAAWRKSSISMDDWFKERAAMPDIAPFSVAVDGTGNVVTHGATPEEALLRAQEEKGSDSWREGLK